VLTLAVESQARRESSRFVTFRFIASAIKLGVYKISYRRNPEHHSMNLSDVKTHNFT